MLADAHGNHHGFFAALEAARRIGPDRIIAAGDMLTPYHGGPEILATLRREGIDCLRGNGDDRLVKWYQAGSASEIRTYVQYGPLHLIGPEFGPDGIDAIRSWPVSMALTNDGGREVVVCHGTPCSNHRSIADHRSEPEATHIGECSAHTIVAGHYHYQWTGHAHGTQLALSGSCGMPCSGETVAQFAIIQVSNDTVRVDHHTASYDLDAFVRELAGCGFARRAGPVGWLLLAQTLTGQPLMLRYFRNGFDHSRRADGDYLAATVKAHLHRHGVLELVEKVFGQLRA